MRTETPAETLPQGRVSKIIQVHPSLKCNLFCKHCYSSSAPQYKEGLSVKSILRILEEGAGMGYNVVSLSGGEPFLYRPLEELVQASKALGYFNSITTNGMLLRSASAQRVFRHVNLVAISIDGREQQHDEMRSMPGAYQKMMEGVDIVKAHVPNFGFIHTVQPDSWQLFPWLAGLAVDKGAALLHLHPLELAGRASTSFGNMIFGEEALLKTYITHYYLKTYYEPQLFIQLDLLHRDHIRDNPAFCFHADALSACDLGDFSCLFRELIIDEHGDLLPIAHGCSKRFRIGNIEEDLPLVEMFNRFAQQRLGELMQVYQQTYDEILNNTEHEIFNWAELVLKNTFRYEQELACAG
ncbi:radical SAM protein [Flavisolibacter nicotianae]|uniref:radical SAM protein n=1 Tax=Flavisolibacter nicotianae TaxID=2364882 RepID=UPI000EAC8E31|nr:radical SAM protein [Flavisolibacter nicotianae]